MEIFFTSQRRSIADTWESLKKNNFSNLVSNIEERINIKSKEGSQSVLSSAVDPPAAELNENGNNGASAERSPNFAPSKSLSSAEDSSSGKCEPIANASFSTRRHGSMGRVESLSRISTLTSALLKSPKQQGKKSMRVQIAEQTKLVHNDVHTEITEHSGLFFPSQGADLRPLARSVAPTLGQSSKKGAARKHNGRVLNDRTEKNSSISKMTISEVEVKSTTHTRSSRQNKTPNEGDGAMNAARDEVGVNAGLSPRALPPDNGDWFFTDGW